MHHPALTVVESIAAMDQRAVIPDQRVAHLPFVMPHELRARGMRPQFVEQAFEKPDLDKLYTRFLIMADEKKMIHDADLKELVG